MDAQENKKKSIQIYQIDRFVTPCINLTADIMINQFSLDFW